MSNLVDLNKQRAAEEKRGLVRWLRPKYQNSDGTSQETAINQPTETVTVPPKEKRPFPKDGLERLLAIKYALKQVQQTSEGRYLSP